MALVRCPVHKIPYNDENPRGCPACARAKDGKGRESVMHELARVSQAGQRPTPAQVQPVRPTPPPVRRGPAPTHPAYRRPSAATAPAPAFSAGLLDKLTQLTGQRQFRVAGAAAAVILVVALVVTSGPQFKQGMYPQVPAGDARPLPLDPNVPVTVAFGALGARTPSANPDSPRLARYTYGTDLTVDVLNGIIYAVSVRIPNRSWRGLHAGMPERTAQGTLALLGTPTEVAPTSAPPPERMGGYWIYGSLDARPRRTMHVEVRPPNGCFDVQVDLQPQAVGTLDDGDRRYAVVGTDEPTLNWVVTQVRIVSRSLRGPYAGVPAC